MSYFHWLTTGSSNGILLEQEKEPAISKPFLPFYSATTLQAPTFEHGCDLSRPLSWQQLADIARRANIIDEHDGKPLADKIEQSARQKITTICIDAIDDQSHALLPQPDCPIGKLAGFCAGSNRPLRRCI